MLLTTGHLIIFRHNGSAGPPSDGDLKRLPQGRFWPNQMFMDALASFIVFAIIVLLAIVAPPGLDQKADPTQKFIAYPAWYFLALYGLLRLAGLTPGSVTPIANLLATVILPGGLVTLLILLPFLDRNPSRQLSRRPWILGLTALTLIFAVGLSLYSQLAVQQEQAEAGETTPTASTNAPAPAGGTGAAPGGASSALAAQGAKVFGQNCASCHQATGQGQPGVFPPLAGNTYVTGDSTKVIHTVLYGLMGSVKVNGTTYNGVMPAWKGQLSNADIAAAITYIRSTWGNNAPPVTEADVAKVPK